MKMENRKIATDIKSSTELIYNLIGNLLNADIKMIAFRGKDIKANNYFTKSTQQKAVRRLVNTIDFLIKERTKIKDSSSLLYRLRYSSFAIQFLKEQALCDPIVIKVIRSLRLLAFDKKYPVESRKGVNDALNKLILKPLLVNLSKSKKREIDPSELLLNFKKEHKRIKNNLRKSYRNINLKSLYLKELYPSLTEEDKNNCKILPSSEIAKYILAKNYGWRYSTVKDKLWEARKKVKFFSPTKISKK